MAWADSWVGSPLLQLGADMGCCVHSLVLTLFRGVWRGMVVMMVGTWLPLQPRFVCLLR